MKDRATCLEVAIGGDRMKVRHFQHCANGLTAALQTDQNLLTHAIVELRCQGGKIRRVGIVKPEQDVAGLEMPVCGAPRYDFVDNQHAGRFGKRFADLRLCFGSQPQSAQLVVGAIREHSLESSARDHLTTPNIFQCAHDPIQWEVVA